MSDLLDQQHMDALLTPLRADSGLVLYPDAGGLTPVSPEPPYVRAYVTIERPPGSPGNALDGLSRRWVTRGFMHCIGENEYAAVAVAMRVRAALLDQRPAIVGRSCGLIREDQALPPAKDDTTGRTVFDLVVVYVFSSN